MRVIPRRSDGRCHFCRMMGIIIYNCRTVAGALIFEAPFCALVFGEAALDCFDGMSNKEERARQAKVFDMLCFPTICNWNSSHRVPDFTKVKRPQPSLSKEMSAAEKSADASSVENVMMRQEDRP